MNLNFEPPQNDVQPYNLHQQLSTSVESIDSMDAKEVKYSPATFLKLERQYLSSIVSQKYAEAIPITYWGQRLDLWRQLQQAFPAPYSIQMPVDEARFL